MRPEADLYPGTLLRVRNPDCTWWKPVSGDHSIWIRVDKAEGAEPLPTDYLLVTGKVGNVYFVLVDGQSRTLFTWDLPFFELEQSSPCAST